MASNLTVLIHPTPNYRAELRGVKVLAMPRDLKTPPPERLKIQGPLGDLAATLEMPEGTPRAAVLHLHPHPMHGGTRQNNVVRYGALGSLEAGCVGGLDLATHFPDRAGQVLVCTTELTSRDAIDRLVGALAGATS